MYKQQSSIKGRDEQTQIQLSQSTTNMLNQISSHQSGSPLPSSHLVQSNGFFARKEKIKEQMDSFKQSWDNMNRNRSKQELPYPFQQNDHYSSGAAFPVDNSAYIDRSHTTPSAPIRSPSRDSSNHSRSRSAILINQTYDEAEERAKLLPSALH